MKLSRAILPVACLTLLLAGCVRGESLRSAPRPAGRSAAAASPGGDAPDGSALRAWEDAGRRALRSRLHITPSFRERVSFPAAEPYAVAYRFRLKPGQRIDVTVQAVAGGQHLVGDVFQVTSDDAFRHVHGSGRDQDAFSFTAPAEGEFVVRLQPPLHAGGLYDVTVLAEASRVFPVAGVDAGAVRSAFGEARDGGARGHEGVDIFAPRGTAVLAVADGYVSSVRTTPVGGRVLWLTDAAAGLSYYYAHLDEHRVREGQRVAAGDTVGTVGNTGNASGSSPHLHFGLYLPGTVAVDPVPLLNGAPTLTATGPASYAAGQRLRVNGERVRLRASPSLAGAILTELTAHTELLVTGDVGDWHRVLLPDGTTGFVSSAFTVPTTRAPRE